MGQISDYIDFSADSSTIITKLKQKSVKVPSWSYLQKMYDYKKHEVRFDKTNLRDKTRKDGTIEKSSRIAIGMERLLVRRMSEFMFAIPVKRIYKNIGDNELRREISMAIENIYKYSRIDTQNQKRGEAFFACCEIATFWYAVKSPNSLYGFDSHYKIKCKTYSPKDGVALYPFFDEIGDMIAFSIEYSVTTDGLTTQYFETWTEDTHYKWEESDGCRKVHDPEEVIILKIPISYLSREEAIYEEVAELRKEIEYTLSRNCNVISYNSAPILKVVGNMVGGEKKGEDYRLFRMQSGGDVGYVSWNQGIEALKYNIAELKELFWSLSQMPDISFSNMEKLGNIGYDARETLLTDAHLRVGDESGDFIEFFEREASIIKAYLSVMKPEWAAEIQNIEIEHVITPFIQRNEDAEINKRMKANGGKPIESQIESIERYGKSSNPQETLDQIRKEETEASQSSLSNIFEGAF